jgi:hypothetical protein
LAGFEVATYGRFSGGRRGYRLNGDVIDQLVAGSGVRHEFDADEIADTNYF